MSCEAPGTTRRPAPLWGLLAGLAGAGLLVGGAAAVPRPAPVGATITIDGDLADWSFPLANPANTTADGDASTIACASSTDRDCPVQSVEGDLRRFAWTWDA